MTSIWPIAFLVGFATNEDPPESYPVELKAGEQGSKLSPRFSPKGTQITLTPKADSELAGFDHLQGRIKVGPAHNQGEGRLFTIVRGEKGKPYDRLYLDAGGDDSRTDGAAIKTRPSLVRDKYWSTFEVTLKVNHAEKNAKAAWEDYPVSFWVVAEKEDETPTVIRYSRSGFLVGSVTIDGKAHSVLLADGDNNAVFGNGDSWAVLPAGSEKFDIESSRNVGDFAWADERAWKLEVVGTSGRSAKLVAFDAGVTRKEDLIRRDRLREDRMAARAEKPVPFRADVDEAIREATKSGKPYFLKFETDWCVPCKQMHQYVFTAKTVVEAAEGVVCVTVDGDKRKDLVESHKVKGYPTGVLFGPDGKEVVRFSGYESVKGTTEFFRKLKKQ